ncbi:glycosyl transferase family 1 [Tamlana nanhaiensis]|uniref:Glycosyl transferase family 1 n=1 Tax=Neotamlana nanhaiensis TaxID=1382798 RepID=A0A0D7W5Y5_9FLAO|nr:glycosyltransferase [Tamlana nanhaiensis]KJD34113.1 glycosyl transferase family 1 [Tamlana nanhaiensis]
MKKALIHDWYTQYGGAERCIESLTNVWDDFDHFTLVDNLTDEQRQIVLKGKQTKTSFIQKLPFGKKKYRSLLPLFPLAIEQFDLRKYELIISSSSSIAKGVLTKPNQLHISYVHSPIRYAWDLYFEYLEESGLNKGFKGILARYFLYKIRQWDFSTLNRPDFYIANSKYVAARIKKIYNKEALVIYPPVNTKSFILAEEKENYFITFSRMVPYKKIDLIVKAFSNSNKKLIVIGDGPDFKKIKKIKTSNVEMLGHVSNSKKIELLRKAKAFIFAAEEDFGISPVEAQASGIPVIAYGKGGALETVNGVFSNDNISNKHTGVFFKEQSVSSIQEAIEFFENNEGLFDKRIIRENVEKFSVERFENEFKETVEKLYKKWKDKQ